MAGTVTAHAETLKLKTVVPIPNGGKITSFDISFVDTATNTYVLGDRTNKGVDVIDTSTNTVRMIAGQGLFKGVVLVKGVANNDVSGPDGVMIVNSSEIWAGDGDSTLKFLSLGNGNLLGQVDTFAAAVANGLPSQGRTRVDEMCFDSNDFIGFVANNAASPPFITAVDAFTHEIIGQIFFDGSSGTPVASNGIEQCQFNPRDGKIYVSVPEVCPDGQTPGSPACPGNNFAPGAVSRINPLTLQVEATAVIPHDFCAGPQGLAIGPVDGKGVGQMLTGCNGAVSNAGPLRQTAIVDDGSQPGHTFQAAYALPFQTGNDMVDFNSSDGHYYLARSGNNSFANPAPDPVTGTPYGCPSDLGPNGTGAINYGGAIYLRPASNANAVAGLGESFGGPSFAGPAVLGMVDAMTLTNDPDTITGLANCTATSPGPGGVGTAGKTNTHGTSHSVAADSGHNQIYVPVASTAVAAGMTGLCSTIIPNQDSLGCIAVFQTVGSGP